MFLFVKVISEMQELFPGTNREKIVRATTLAAGDREKAMDLLLSQSIDSQQAKNQKVESLGKVLKDVIEQSRASLAALQKVSLAVRGADELGTPSIQVCIVWLFCLFVVVCLYCIVFLVLYCIVYWFVCFCSVLFACLCVLIVCLFCFITFVLFVLLTRVTKISQGFDTRNVNNQEADDQHSRSGRDCCACCRTVGSGATGRVYGGAKTRRQDCVGKTESH
jgi:hypothetical protein